MLRSDAMSTCGVLPSQPCFATAGDLVAQHIQPTPGCPPLNVQCNRYSRRCFRLKLLDPSPAPHVVGQDHDQIFQVINFSPATMTTSEPCEPGRDAVVFEQGRAVDLVLAARAGEFFGVSYLADVVDRCPEQDGVTVEDEARKSGSDPVEKLDGDIVDEDQVPDKKGRCPKLFAEAGGIGMQRNRCH